MSETNKASAPRDSAPAKPVVPPRTGANAGAPQRSPRPQITAALVLSLIAICLSLGFAASAYFIWSQVQQLAGREAELGTRVDERLQPLRVSVDKLSQALESASRDSERRLQDIDQRLDRLAEDQKAYDNRLGVLTALMGRSEQGWSLAEVEYLLRIASQRLQLQRDVDTAEAALKIADARLRDLADPHYLPVREQLARDLEALGGIPEVDRDGIALTLSAWLDRVDALPVAGARYQPRGDAESAGLDTATTAANWKEIPTLVWAALSELLQLREHDAPVSPMLPPEQEYFLRENIRLQLAAARLALMRNDEAQYQAALSTSRDWLSSHFSTEDAQVGELVSKLDELGAIDIRPDLPALSGSLRLLRQQMKLSQQQEGLPVAPESRAVRTPEPDPDNTAEDATGGGAQ